MECARSGVNAERILFFSNRKVTCLDCHKIVCCIRDFSERKRFFRNRIAFRAGAAGTQLKSGRSISIFRFTDTVRITHSLKCARAFCQTFTSTYFFRGFSVRNTRCYPMILCMFSISVNGKDKIALANNKLSW